MGMHKTNSQVTLIMMLCLPVFAWATVNPFYTNAMFYIYNGQAIKSVPAGIDTSSANGDPRLGGVWYAEGTGMVSTDSLIGLFNNSILPGGQSGGSLILPGDTQKQAINITWSSGANALSGADHWNVTTQGITLGGQMEANAPDKDAVDGHGWVTSDLLEPVIIPTLTVWKGCPVKLTLTPQISANDQFMSASIRSDSAVTGLPYTFTNISSNFVNLDTSKIAAGSYILTAYASTMVYPNSMPICSVRLTIVNAPAPSAAITTSVNGVLATTMSIGQTAMITANFVQPKGTPDPLSAESIAEPEDKDLSAVTYTLPDRDGTVTGTYAFTPTVAGTYTFYARAATSAYPETTYASTTIVVNSAVGGGSSRVLTLSVVAKPNASYSAWFSPSPATTVEIKVPSK